MVSLGKTGGTLPNHITVKCPRREQTYVLEYMDGERHRVRDWLGLAACVLREDHKARHEAQVLELTRRHLVRGR
jgi:hypothetical protein